MLEGACAAAALAAGLVCSHAQAAVPILLYPVADTFVSNHPDGGPNVANTSFGSETTLHVYQTGPGGAYKSFSLVKFDLTPYAGFVVVNPNFFPYFAISRYNSGGTSGTVELDRMNVAWSESSTFNSLGGASLPGTATFVTQRTISADNQYYVFEGSSSYAGNMKNVIQSWIDTPSANQGLLLNEVATPTTHFFYSRESGQQMPHINFQAEPPAWAPTSTASNVSVDEGSAITLSVQLNTSAHYGWTSRNLSFSSGSTEGALLTQNGVASFSGLPSVQTASASIRYDQSGTFTAHVSGSAAASLSTGLSGFDRTASLSRNITVTVNNVAPSVVNATLNGLASDLVVDEGSVVTAQMASIDPGRDAQTFTIGGISAGVGGVTGTRTSNAIGLSFADDGAYAVPFHVSDGDGGFAQLSRIVTVRNVAPTFISAPADSAVAVGASYSFSAAAIDPGIYDQLTYDWDLDGDGQYNDHTGASGATAFSGLGQHTVSVRVSDGKDFSTRSFQVTASSAFTGAQSNQWDDAGNWSAGAPASNVPVILVAPASGARTITGPAANATVQALAVGDASTGGQAILQLQPGTSLQTLEGLRVGRSGVITGGTATNPVTLYLPQTAAMEVDGMVDAGTVINGQLVVNAGGVLGRPDDSAYVEIDQSQNGSGTLVLGGATRGTVFVRAPRIPTTPGPNMPPPSAPVTSVSGPGALLGGGVLVGFGTATASASLELISAESAEKSPQIFAPRLVVSDHAQISPGDDLLNFSFGMLYVDGELSLDSTVGLNFDLSDPNTIGGGLNDLIVVTNSEDALGAGDLVLDGLLNVAARPGFGYGSYTLFTYAGALTDRGLSLGQMPAGYTYDIDTTMPGHVMLVVAPEPASLSLFAVATGVFLARRHRRWPREARHRGARATTAFWSGGR